MVIQSQTIENVIVRRSISLGKDDCKEPSFDKRNANSVVFHDKENGIVIPKKPTIKLPEPVLLFSPRPLIELDAAATKLQKVYRGYRTRRNLADCAVVVEELWWKTLDSAALRRCSISFYDIEKQNQETVISKWARAKTRAAKVGKGLSKDEKAQNLALQHWLEAIDPRHRYGHNLHFYYDVWSASKSTQPFFYWFDIGDGKELNLKECQRKDLQQQCIKYLGPKEREAFEVMVESGKLVYKQSGMLVNTIESSKWIFVLSTSRSLYVGQKKKGVFQHSSFLSGGATTAAGRLMASQGVLERCAIDDDYPSYKVASDESESKNGEIKDPMATRKSSDSKTLEISMGLGLGRSATNVLEAPPAFINMAKRVSCKWSSGVGPRIGCARDYPTELQSQALEQVNLSPRVTPPCRFGNSDPIPSPRPSPNIRVSPRLAYMGLPSPRLPSCGCNKSVHT